MSKYPKYRILNPIVRLPYWFIETKDSELAEWVLIDEVYPDTFEEAMDHVRVYQEKGYKPYQKVAWESD